MFWMRIGKVSTENAEIGTSLYLCSEKIYKNGLKSGHSLNILMPDYNFFPLLIYL